MRRFNKTFLGSVAVLVIADGIWVVAQGATTVGSLVAGMGLVLFFAWLQEVQNSMPNYTALVLQDIEARTRAGEKFHFTRHDVAERSLTRRL